VQRIEDVFHDYKKVSARHREQQVRPARPARLERREPEAVPDAPGRGHTAQ